MEIKEQKFDISWSAIFKVLFTFFVCYIFYLAQNILVWVIFSGIIAILFEPLISFLEEKKIPRAIGAVVVYSAFFALFGLFLYWMVPVFVSEIQQLTKILPQYFAKISEPLQNVSGQIFGNIETFAGSIQESLTSISSNVVKVIVSVFGSIFSAITIFTLSIFFSIEKDEIKRLVALFLPDDKKEYFFDLWRRCQSRTSAWFSARVLSGLFIGFASYGILLFFKVDYSFALSVFAGLSDFVPIIGPIVSGFIFAFLTLFDSWTKALLIVILFTLIQQIEANVVMPLVSKKMVGLPATLTLITLLIGGKLWGIAGAILALPLVGIIYEFVKDLLKNKKHV